MFSPVWRPIVMRRLRPLVTDAIPSPPSGAIESEAAAKRALAADE
jgi:hypothetical protein